MAASASAGLASTDCEKWLAEYKQELVHKASVQRALNAKRRAKNYARRRIGELISPAAAPKPHPVRLASTRPHLTPAQMLKRFDVLCGDLPLEATNQVLDGRMAPDEFISETAMGGPVDTEILPPEDVLLAGGDLPSYVPSESSPGGGYGQPFWPVYGSAPGFGGPGSLPIVAPPVPLPPISAVPEPGSVFLVLTGVAGAAGSYRRRRIVR